MKQSKFIIIGAAVIGLIALFLPYVSEGPISLSLWDFHKAPSGNEGLLNGPKQVYLGFVFFGVPLLLAGLAAMGKIARWQGITAGVFFLLAFSLKMVRHGMTSIEGVHPGVGGKLVFLAALVGLVGAVIAAAKPEQA